jgi:hypothetical protein
VRHTGLTGDRQKELLDQDFDCLVRENI